LRRFKLRRIDPERILTPNDCFILRKEIEISILLEWSEIHYLTGKELSNIYMHIHKNIKDLYSEYAIDRVKMGKEICKEQGSAIFQMLKVNFENNYETFYIAQMVREYRWLFFYLLKSHLRTVKEYLEHHNLTDKEDNGPAIVQLNDELNLYGSELAELQECGYKTVGFSYKSTKNSGETKKICICS
jgi:hypothetical protein